MCIRDSHGTVSYGEDVEKAYWWTEILDAYCRMLMLAKGLGNVSFFTEDKERELLSLKEQWGWTDPRTSDEYADCDICSNDIFRDSWADSGVERRAFVDPSDTWEKTPNKETNGAADEKLVQMITDQVLEEIKKQQGAA